MSREKSRPRQARVMMVSAPLESQCTARLFVGQLAPRFSSYGYFYRQIGRGSFVSEGQHRLCIMMICVEIAIRSLLSLVGNIRFLRLGERIY